MFFFWINSNNRFSYYVYILDNLLFKYLILLTYIKYNNVCFLKKYLILQNRKNAQKLEEIPHTHIQQNTHLWMVANQTWAEYFIKPLSEFNKEP